MLNVLLASLSTTVPTVLSFEPAHAFCAFIKGMVN